MKANTSLLALGLFTVAGVVSMSCGGSSDSGDTSTQAGTSSKAGTGSNTAGSASSAGTTNNTGGNGNTAGTVNNNNGGRANTAGTANNNGGAFNFPGAGGAGFTIPSCAAGTMDGAACTAMQGQNACQLDDTTYCGCQGQNDPTWTCVDTTNLQGAGGFPQATCPANAMNGDDCSGQGQCTGQLCICGQGNKVMCL